MAKTRKPSKKISSKKKTSGKKRKAKRSPKRSPKVSHKQVLIAVAVIVGVTFIAYSPVLQAGFVDIDDKKLILDKGSIFMKDPMAVLKTSRPSPHYKPVTYFTWLLEYRAVQDAPFLYHFNNLLLHILNSILVFFLVRRVSRQFEQTKKHEFYIALFSGLLFALHPLHVESVAWVVERKDVLYTCFYLSSLLTYARYLDKGTKVHLGLSALFFLLSCFSKSPGITAIGMLFLFDFAWQRKFGPKLFIEKAGHFAVFFFALYMLGFFRGSGEGSIAAMTDEKLLARSENVKSLPGVYGKAVLASMRGWLWYLHSILPFRSSIGYPREAIINFFGGGIHVFLPLLVAAAAFLLYNARKYPLLFFGHVFFFIALVPAMVRLGLGIGIFMSDRYVYLALFGLVFLFAAWIMTLRSEKLTLQTRQSILGAVCLLFAFLSFQNSRVWNGTETLWTNVIEKYPSVPYSYVNRGSFYREQELYDKALADLNIGVSKEDNANARIQRGLVYRQMGQSEAAIRDYTRALELKPGDTQAWVNRGNAYLDARRFQEAIQDYNRVLEVDNNVKAGVNRAIAYASLGDFASAQQSFAAVEPYAEGSPIFFMNRGIMWVEMGQLERALADYTRYLSFKPNDHQMHNDRGVVLARLGRYQEAIQSYTTAINISPVKVYFASRARSYEALGMTAEAQADLQRSR